MTIEVKSVVLDNEIRAIISGEVSTDIQKALGDMTRGWNEVRYYGNKRGHHFQLTGADVLNGSKWIQMEDSDLIASWYHAGCPECITLTMD